MYNDSSGVMECHNNKTGPLFELYCGGLNLTEEGLETTENEYCRYFIDNTAELRRGIPGLKSGVFMSKSTIVLSFSAYFNRHTQYS